MLNLKFYYDKHSTRMQIDGLPDLSKGDDNGTIGIISSWKLQIAGFPELQGQKKHLQTLIDVIYPYIRCYLLGIKRGYGDQSSCVSIQPHEGGHKLVLRSSKENISNLEIVLDDAELVDLVTCLDKFRKDERIKLSWDLKYDNKTIPRFKIFNDMNISLFIPFILGASSFLIASIAIILIPNDQLFLEKQDRSHYYQNNKTLTL